MNPIADAEMTTEQVFDGLSKSCPEEIRSRQTILNVRYHGFDSKVHVGQIVVHRDLGQDVKEIFDVAYGIRFPIHSVIPMSHKKFRKADAWDDNLSMEANNTSAFNYRVIAGTQKLSNHAFGRAVDINPRQNPFVKGDIILPKGSAYRPGAPGTLDENHPLVLAFIERGWEWGGHWKHLKDYHHFEKISSRTGFA